LFLFTLSHVDVVRKFKCVRQLILGEQQISGHTNDTKIGIDSCNYLTAS